MPSASAADLDQRQLEPSRAVGTEEIDPPAVSGLSQATARELPRRPRSRHRQRNGAHQGIQAGHHIHRHPAVSGHRCGRRCASTAIQGRIFCRRGDARRAASSGASDRIPAARRRACCRPGGRLAMIEPAMTPMARRFYERFHEEPVDMQADPFAPVAINPDRDPFDANQAIPSLLFTSQPARRRLEAGAFRRCACRSVGLAEPVRISA